MYYDGGGTSWERRRWASEHGTSWRKVQTQRTRVINLAYIFFPLVLDPRPASCSREMGALKTVQLARFTYTHNGRSVCSEPRWSAYKGIKWCATRNRIVFSFYFVFHRNFLMNRLADEEDCFTSYVYWIAVELKWGFGLKVVRRSAGGEKKLSRGVSGPIVNPSHIRPPHTHLVVPFYGSCI